jgi:hypothetical protein
VAEGAKEWTDKQNNQAKKINWLRLRMKELNQLN